MTPRAAIPVVALLLAGCSAGPAPAKPRPSPTADPHEFARRIAESASSMRTAHEDWREACDGRDELGCAITGLNFATTVDTVSIVVEGFTDPASKVYAGAPLVGDAGRLAGETGEDAKTLAALTKQYATPDTGLGCNETKDATAECVSLLSDINSKWDVLQADLAKWEKY